LLVESIFGQVSSASYEESMPANCTLADAAPYAVRHNPEAYYVAQRPACRQHNVAFARFKAGALPQFAFITPNLCNDTHDCDVATGDAWLRSHVPPILSSAGFRTGRTAVFITWDEDDNGASNHVPLLVLSASTPTGARSGAAFDHYSLLATTESMLGVGCLGAACGAPTLRDAFDVPDLATMDDSIADGTFELQPGAPEPLSLFRAARVDYSLRRLYHYTGTDPEHFQNFVIFTNYQFYVDAFAQLCQQRLQSGEAGLEAFVAPGNVITGSGGATSGVAPARAPQMPAFHLVAPGYRGITLINIGTGPSNARNVTDHVAVLRPHAWLMLGHCAGLRNTQRLGDYVLAHGYVREDHVLDRELPLWVPIPALAEMQVALEQAVEDVTGLEGFELKRLMRTGTVASVDNRNWEISGPEVIRRMSQSRAVALDMESAAIAANGYRFRVPYGTLLCVSDKPLHGEIKLAGMASEFYRRRVGQHLEIGLKALERLKQQESERLHSRKLRSFAEVAFQ